MDYGVSRGCETFKRDKLAENDNITVCRIFICISYNHYAFSKSAVIVPLIGASFASIRGKAFFLFK